jgi:hypothetical protein
VLICVIEQYTYRKKKEINDQQYIKEKP